MPLDDFLKNYKPGDDFTFESLRDAVLEEYGKDQTAWRAAVAERDGTITATKADLQKAQAAAWEAYQKAPAGDDDPNPGGDAPDDMDALRARVFTTVERD